MSGLEEKTKSSLKDVVPIDTMALTKPRDDQFLSLGTDTSAAALARSLKRATSFDSYPDTPPPVNTPLAATNDIIMTGESPRQINPKITLDPSFADTLERVFDAIDLTAPIPHEIIGGLIHHGVTTWDSFLLMDDEYINQLTRNHRHGSLALSHQSTDLLYNFKQLIWEQIDNKADHALEPTSYTKDMFQQFTMNLLAEKRKRVQQTLNTTTTPAFGSNSSSKPIGEKKYDSWTRGRRAKESFAILVSDKQYLVWKPKFEAELVHQKLQHVVDPTYDPGLITCSYERLMWTEQVAYLWTVLMHVFQNPFGKSCISDHIHDRNARLAFLDHEDLHATSSSKIYDSGSYLTSLQSLSIRTYNGTRVEFVTEWFERLRLLNEISIRDYSYDFARTVLLSGLTGDSDLPDCFTELVITDNDVVDIQFMKKYIIHKASLYDRRDDLLRGAKRVPSSRAANTTHLRDLYPNEDLDVLQDIHDYAIHRTQRTPNPASRLPDSIFSTLDHADKAAWRRLSEATRIKVLASQPDPPVASSRRPERRAYTSEVESPPFDTLTEPSTITDDIADIPDFERLYVNTAATRPRRSSAGSSSGTRPPYTKTSTNGQSVTFDSTPPITKSAKTLPLRSTMSPAHPSVLLADKPTNLYDKDGHFQGYINKFHRWFTDSEETLSDESLTAITYNVSKRSLSSSITMSLCDRGANGFVGGSDCVLIGHPVVPRSVSITGINNHQVRNVPIATVGAYVVSNRGPVICVFHEVAYTGQHQTIMSSIQMEHHGIFVDEKSPAVGGTARISTPDGFVFPLSFRNGLAYMKMRPYSTAEYDQLPHVIMTSDKMWDPRVFDKDVDPNDPIDSDKLTHLPHQDYDLQGEFIHASNRIIAPDEHHHSIEFDEFVSDELFEDAVDDINLAPPDPVSVDFWLHESDYIRNETIARCVHSAIVSSYDDDVHIHTTISTPSSDPHITATPRVHTPSKRNYQSLQPLFAWLPTKMIAATFKNSTQYGFQPASPDGNLFKRWHSPNPAMNVFRMNDDLLTDKVYSDTAAVDSGYVEAQIFFGRKSHIIHVEPLSKIRKFIHCLQDFVRKWGAPNRLLGDHAGNQCSFRVMDYLRLLWIGFWCSEPYYQHQNMFERRYQAFKRVTNRLMDRTGSPPELWFLCMCYVAYVMNRTSDPSLNNRQPVFVATGRIGDISPFMTFQWMEPVYYKLDDSAFPSSSKEAFGYWVGIAEHVGHAMTYKIWNKLTNKILHRSVVRTALDPTRHNQRVYPSIKDTDGIVGQAYARWLQDSVSSTHPPSTESMSRIKSCQDYGEHVTGRPPDFIYSDDDVDDTIDSPNYGETAYLSEDCISPHNSNTDVKCNTDDPIDVVYLDSDGNPNLNAAGKPIMISGKSYEDLKGMTFMKREEDGTARRARVIDTIISEQNSNDELRKFKIKYDSTQVEDIIAYNDIMNFIHRDKLEDGGEIWKFRRVLSHQGPLTHRDNAYNGSKYNVEIEWENGEITYEPLGTVIADDPITIALYAHENGLLDTDGWKRLKPIARRKQKLRRLVNQVKLRSFRTAPRYMYGFQVPRNYSEALTLDEQNGNTKWQDATSLEMAQLDDYDTFLDKGIFTVTKIPVGFKKIRIHLVFAVKHDGRHKARMCADGNLTDVPANSVYAGVVSLRGLRMCIFIAELNGMEAYATDIGNAYLEALTQEKVCIKAGPEFGEREGHLLIIYKALYGLRSSGKEFGDLLATCLKELGFFQSLAEPEIFMRESEGIYEYVATYVDDLCLVMRNPEAFLTQLQAEPYNFKLKGSGPMSFHLGCGFERDCDGILVMDPKKYIDKMIQGYEHLFGCKPNTRAQSPLEENDHPELDTTEFLDEDGIQKYQCLIGSLQWIISIGRWDVQTAVMTLSSFRAQPRIGHLDRAKRIYGYIVKFRHFTIKFRVDEPDLSSFDNKLDLDWSKSVYGDHEEEIASDAPIPLGKKVTLIHYFDANLIHDVLSGKAVTGCIHLANKTPIMWYSKKQATTETATYGAEFVAGRTCIEQVVDLRNSFRYLGIPVHSTSYIFGDNETMVNSASFPYARLHKRHNILSYHFVRSMIARGFIALHHLRSKNNLSDVLTKHWSHNSVYDLLRPLFHHVGNTAKLYTDDSPGCLDTVFHPAQTMH
jgi:hypothetical protein